MSDVQVKEVEIFLEKNKVQYRIYSHEPVYTSEQAAAVRGVDLKSGVKALVLKTDGGGFVMGLVAANRRIDTKKLSKTVGTKKISLANPEEVFEITGCKIGSVHPFGNLSNLKVYMDKSVLDNHTVNFNAGLHTISIQMNSSDLVKVINPIICDIS